MHRYSQRGHRATQHRETVAAEGAGETATAQLHCRHHSRVCVPQTREEAAATKLRRECETLCVLRVTGLGQARILSRSSSGQSGGRTLSRVTAPPYFL